MGKIAEQLEKIIDIHKTFYNGEVRGADLAHNIELYILDAKPKKYECPMHGLNRLNSCNSCIMVIDKNQALKEWENNLCNSK